jgi:peptidoglycan/xylan/chitin deacetylase (PgdA/CDA1 family)
VRPDRKTGRSLVVTTADLWEAELIAGGQPLGGGWRAVRVAGDDVELFLRESCGVRVRTSAAGMVRRLARRPVDHGSAGGVGRVGLARYRPARLVRAAVRRALVSVVSVRTGDPLVALTFDDGPDPRLSPAVLDVLQEHDVRATFLLVAERVRQHPELARRVVAAGHEVGLHGDRHEELLGQPFGAQYRALRRGRRDMEALLGVRVRWFRPPYGKQEPETVLACRLAGMRPLLWSTSAHDWEAHQSLEDQLAHADRGLRPGAVVLLHDGAAAVDDPAPPLPHTQPGLTERLLELVRRRGLEPVTVSRLIASGDVVHGRWFERWLHH